MLIDLLAGVLGAYNSVAYEIVDSIFLKFTGKHLNGKDPESFEEKIIRLMERLRTSSTEVDGLLQEMQQTIKDREIAVTQLETKLADLNQRTESREKLIKDLEEKRLSQEVIQDILGTFEDTERRTSRQNWYFFIAGVLLSIPVGFLINIASTSMGF